VSAIVDGVQQYAGPNPAQANLSELLHDLRQPTSAIVLLAGSAELEEDDPAAIVRRLRQIRAEAVWLSHLVESSCDGDEPRVVDVREVVNDCVDRVDVVCPARVLATDVPTVYTVAAPVGLRRALTNIISNAARAAGPRGEVQVRVAANDDVVIQVTDDGPGFGHLPVMHGAGLKIARDALAGFGGRLEITPGSDDGSCVSLVLERGSGSQRAGYA
jgi:K+-sensing histidine kinase KdpD